jgi:hypothetical protein
MPSCRAWAPRCAHACGEDPIQTRMPAPLSRYWGGSVGSRGVVAAAQHGPSVGDGRRRQAEAAWLSDDARPGGDALAQFMAGMTAGWVTGRRHLPALADGKPGAGR